MWHKLKLCILKIKEQLTMLITKKHYYYCMFRSLRFRHVAARWYVEKRCFFHPKHYIKNKIIKTKYGDLSIPDYFRYISPNNCNKKLVNKFHAANVNEICVILNKTKMYRLLLNNKIFNYYTCHCLTLPWLVQTREGTTMCKAAYQ